MKCTICNSKYFNLICADGQSNLMKCNQCGLIFYHPLPSILELKNYYSSQNGYLPSIEPALKLFKKNKLLFDGKHSLIITRIKKFIQNIDRLLDIGCAHGFFLSYCKELGVKPFGVEISAQTSEYAAKQGLNIYNCSLQEVKFDSNFFDAVTSFHCLEHSLNPYDELKEIYRILKKDGVLYLAVPNAGSLVANHDISTWKWKSWPNHLYYFSPFNIRLLLEKCGLEIMDTISQVGDSDQNDDLNILGKILNIDVNQNKQEALLIMNILYNLGKGQELVVIGRKGYSF